jgi:hypothetical protein
MDPNRKNPDPAEDSEPVADESYTTSTREGSDFPNLDVLTEAYTDEEDESTSTK